jgi:hypothetical protein
MRDPRTDTYNFDERLRILPDPKEIDLKRLPPYVTASKDTVRRRPTRISEMDRADP